MLKAAVGCSCSHAGFKVKSSKSAFAVQEEKNGGALEESSPSPGGASKLLLSLNIERAGESMSLQLSQRFANWIQTAWKMCKLRKRLQRYATLNHAVKLIEWDQKRQLGPQEAALAFRSLVSSSGLACRGSGSRRPRRRAASPGGCTSGWNGLRSAWGSRSERPPRCSPCR